MIKNVEKLLRLFILGLLIILVTLITVQSIKIQHLSISTSKNNSDIIASLNYLNNKLKQKEAIISISDNYLTLAEENGAKSIIYFKDGWLYEQYLSNSITTIDKLSGEKLIELNKFSIDDAKVCIETTQGKEYTLKIK